MLIVDQAARSSGVGMHLCEQCRTLFKGALYDWCIEECMDKFRRYSEASGRDRDYEAGFEAAGYREQ